MALADIFRRSLPLWNTTVLSWRRTEEIQGSSDVLIKYSSRRVQIRSGNSAGIGPSNSPWKYDEKWFSVEKYLDGHLRLLASPLKSLLSMWLATACRFIANMRQALSEQMRARFYTTTGKVELHSIMFEMSAMTLCRTMKNLALTA
jgi:hypothetical protein